MTRHSRSIILAVGCGALIGGIVAQAIGSSAAYHNLWSLGALFGGFVAWALYDPADFRAGVSRAWVEARADFVDTCQAIAKWRPNRRYWALWRATFKLWWLTLATGTLGLLSVLSSLAAVGIFIVFCIEDTSRFARMMSPPHMSMFTAVFIVCVCIFGSFVMTTAANNGKNWRCRRGSLNDMRRSMLLTMIYANPVGLVVVLCVRLVLAAPYAKVAGRLMWAAVRSGVHFVGYTIAYVHSTPRTICLVDTTIVVAVCYISLGSVTAVLVGTVAGPIVGLINFWVVAPFLERIQMATVSD